jgi:hypothetical protein
LAVSGKKIQVPTSEEDEPLRDLYKSTRPKKIFSENCFRGEDRKQMHFEN